jgi:hypothetical protein
MRGRDPKQCRAVANIGGVGVFACFEWAEIRLSDLDRDRHHASYIPLRDQVPRVSNRLVMATLQADHIEDACVAGCLQELTRLGRGHSERPFAIDRLARADRRVDHLAMKRRFDGDHHQIDVRVFGHPARIREGVRRSKMPGCGFRRLGA